MTGRYLPDNRLIPSGLMLLEARTHQDLVVAIRFRPSLAPMHLKPPTGLTVHWDNARGQLNVREPGRQVELGVRSLLPAEHRRLPNGQEEIRLHLTSRMA